ncbi:hypothetical protein EV361DRAFT_796310 [Lentinula raphanica]|nr:hypothetical protein EV361DRAFT_796310 [Lentinula raphanica]
MILKAASIDANAQALRSVQLTPTIETRLGLLIQIAEVLETDEASTTSSLTTSIAHLSRRRLDLKLSLNRAMYVEEELRTHLAKLEVELALIRKWSASMNQRTEMSETETAETLELRRQAIVRKAKEHQAELIRLNSTKASSSSTNITISDLALLQTSNAEREKEIRRKRKKVEAFRGLPPNPELARLTLLQATQRLQDLSRIREGLLNRMVGDVQDVLTGFGPRR